MKKFGYCLFAVLLVIGLLNANSAYSKPTPGGILKIISGETPVSPFGWPPESRGESTNAQVPVLESLWHIDKDKKLQPVLAESWDIAPDWKTITFHLRKGVKFHDGSDWNAEAARFNLQARKDKRKTGTNKWVSIEVLDEFTLRLKLSAFQNSQKNIIGLVRMVSPTAVKKNGLDWARFHPVGTGPFKFKSYKRDVSLEYVKNENYWDKGKPYLDGVKFIYIKDKMTQATAMKAGEAHVLRAAQATKIAADLKSAGFNVTPANSGSNCLAPDTIHPDSIFSNKLVREAIEHAIDRESIVKFKGYGLWTPLNQICPPLPGMYGLNPAIKGRAYDPQKAKELLAKAGYPNGFKTKLIIPTAYADRDVGVAIQSYLGQVGIKAELEIVNMSRFVVYRKKGWKDALLWMIVNMPEGKVLIGWEYFLKKGGLVDYHSLAHPAGWAELMEKALAEPDFAKETKLVQQMSKLAYDDATLIPIYTSGRCAIVKPGVHDTRFFEQGSAGWWNVRGTWLDKDLQ